VLAVTDSSVDGFSRWNDDDGASDASGEEQPLPPVHGAASIRYRIALGQGTGGRTLTLKNPAPGTDRFDTQAVHRQSGRLLAECRRRLPGASARPARAVVPVYNAAIAQPRAAFNQCRRSGRLCTEEPVPRRHHTHPVQSGGLYRPPCRAGPTPAAQSHPLPWRLRPELAHAPCDRADTDKRSPAKEARRLSHCVGNPAAPSHRIAQ
jgi:hypothetical protein